MSLILTGNLSNVTAPLTVAFSAIANNGSGLARVTTSAPHLFATGDQVMLLEGIVQVGVYTITVIDSTHFDLNNTLFVGTASGTAVDLTLTPQILVPTDGDTGSLQLSGVLSALQALCDRTQYLAKQTVPLAYMLAGQMTFRTNTGGFSWTTWASGTGPGSSYAEVAGTKFSASAVAMPTLNTGDILDFAFGTTLGLTTANTIFTFGLMQQVFGSAVFTQQQGTGFLYPTGYNGALSLSARNALIGERYTAVTISGVAGTTGTLTGLSGLAAGAVGASVTISGAANAGNNGTFQITSFVSSSSVQYSNPAAVFPDAHSGSLVVHLDNITFDVDVQVAGSGVFNFLGDYSQTVSVWRPNNRAALVIQ